MFKARYSPEVKSAAIAAVVALVVAAPMSSGAHHQARVVIKKIAGKQGKRGPRGFRGATGAAGPAGVQGPKGERGATGAAGNAYPDLQSNTPVSIPGHSIASVGDTCNSGYFATDGSVDNGVVIRESIQGSGQYAALVANPTGTAIVATATAACSPL